MRRLKSFKTAGSNSMLCWHKAKDPFAVTFNFLVISLSKVLPSLSAKRALLRFTGMRIGNDVAIGLGVQFDIFWPELITLKDNCMLGYGATILCHEFLVREYRTGPVVIGRNAMVGTNTTVLAGVEIGDNATVSACSLVNKDIAAGSFAGGVPAKLLKRAE